MSPHGVLFAALVAEDFAGDSLPDLGEHLVAQPGHMPVVDTDLHGWQHLAHRIVERGRRVECHHLQLIAPGLGALPQPPSDIRTGVSINEPEGVAGISVNEGADRAPAPSPAPGSRS